MEQAKQQAEQRRLAAAGRADDGDHLMRLHLQIQLLQNGRAALIGKLQPLQRQRQRNALADEPLRTLRVVEPLPRQLQHGHDAPRGDGGLDGGGDQMDERAERRGEIGRQLQEQHHRAEVDPALPQAVSTPAEAEVAYEHAARREERRGQNGEALKRDAGVIIPLLHAIEPLAEGIDEVEGLDGGDVLQRLLLKGRHFAADGAHIAVEAAHFSHKRSRQQQRHGRAQQGQHCRGRVVDQNDGQRGQKLRQPQDERRDPAKHAARHIGHVRVDAAEQVAGVKLLQGFPVRVQEHAEDLGAQLVADAEVDLCTEAADEGIEHDGRAGQQHDGDAAEQHAPPAALQIDDGVDELA